MEFILRLVAFVGAIAHVFFFYKEALKWDVTFVKMAAPSWVERVGGDEKAIPYVVWASDLAINVGTYNLVLAVGLAWVRYRRLGCGWNLGNISSRVVARSRSRGLLHQFHFS